MTHECTEERFLKDVSHHHMAILRDDGVCRHVRFSRPDTICMQFDLITWPGKLCYTGDMGTYVFQRTEDMFEFFRTDRRDRGTDKLYINLGYWTEKLIAVDGSRHGARIKEFDADKFRRVINEYRVNWMRRAKERSSLDKDERRDLWEEVDNEVISRIDDGGDPALLAASDFSYNPSLHKGRSCNWSFDDLFEHDFTEYTHSIVWCCYALAWGIKKYDDAKTLDEAAAAAGELAEAE